MQAIMRLPRKGDGVKLNVYTQLNEPSKKEGLWIKVNDKYENVEIVDSLSKTFYKQLDNIPYNKSVLIEKGSTYNAKLSDKLKVEFNNVKYYDNDSLQDNEAYIGDGTTWTKIN